MSHGSKGFTLVEVLVSMAVLAIIVLIMAQVFMASSKAWQSGLRQVEMSMEGRVAIIMIARDFEQALADDTLPLTIANNAMTFFTAAHPGADSRAVKRVQYQRFGNELRRQVRPVGPWAGNYPVLGAGDGWVPLVGNVIPQGFTVTTPPGWTDADNQLPRWVDVELTLESSAGQTAVRVWSYGPDGRADTDDDITSWR